MGLWVYLPHPALQVDIRDLVEDSSSGFRVWVVRLRVENLGFWV